MLATAPASGPWTPSFGPWTILAAPAEPFGVEIHGLHGEQPAPADYLHDVLLAPAHREAMLAWIDRVGLVVCLDVRTAHPSYQDVRGRSSRGRLSQGEYYHHDGCSGPTKPRVVEIRCPHQAIERRVATAVAPFPDTVYAMLRALPASIAGLPEIAGHRARLSDDGGLPRETWDTVQGVVTRAVRRELDAESARAYFRDVDAVVRAYRAPWRMGESRLIANANPGVTMQHRRAYLEPHEGGRPSGHLVKRWPAEVLE
ncbi:MAG: hypothetical protein JNK45_37660 [Myxococcales bacterium]|nr:hypothetical protein [Myxococcales bacterium]